MRTVVAGQARNAVSVVCGAAVACVLVNAIAARQNETFRSGISLVHVDIEVVDANHRVLTGLRKQDFRIFDSGSEQPILSIAADEQPLDLVLLFDISLSMRGVVQQIAEAAQSGLRQLHKGDRVCVMAFNTRSTLMLPFTDDLQLAQSAVQRNLMEQRFGGGTAIQSAVADAGERFGVEASSERRRAILIVTDDIGIRTRREESVVHELWRADASLSGLIVRDAKFNTAIHVRSILAPETLLLQAGMKGIAEKTGGDVLHSKDGDVAFRDMMHRVRSRISLYYRMPEGKRGEARRVKVELSTDAAKRIPGAVVRARHGYIVP
jgi:VWFA-related protein